MVDEILLIGAATWMLVLVKFHSNDVGPQGTGKSVESKGFPEFEGSLPKWIYLGFTIYI